MTSIFATHSPCCSITRTGVQEPGVMHSGACRRKHNGVLGPTLYLVLTPESQRELDAYEWGRSDSSIIDEFHTAPISLEERENPNSTGGGS